MKQQEYLFDLHEDHIEWLKALAFYEDELQILKNRLGEVSFKNTDQAIKMQVEKFQNQFLIQKNEIDYLKHYINQDEKSITDEILSNPTASDRRKADDNIELRDRYETFITLFGNLKEEFNDFAGKNL
ncbi:MAG: hypothetical protein MUF45_05635 [Spirosomaceae bacterium]|jgi:DNA gyrase/topoisomerase IV subunit B|nr:hypothetical protein [Spirosomataceae bacterium]